ncbi:amino acid ABC transporter permease [Arthrobacter sp. NPDC090010]|uniref:amino acid ABC transporter permease n=1 Tax=Arthrobacter sp. NPDC090010 TaxID=3363942 RepID=UPI003830498A
MNVNPAVPADPEQLNAGDKPTALSSGRGQPSASSASEPPSEAIPVVPLRHPGRVAMAAILLIVAALAAMDIAMNQRYHWDVVVSFLFAPQIMTGAGLTLLLTVVSMTVGIALGTGLAVMRLSANPVLRTISRAYIWFFRGTPLLVQLIFWYNIAALYPVIALGLPFGGPSWVIGSANVLITPLGAALLGLSLNEAAYMAEIIRGGISSVDKGQYEAARALGMKKATLMRRIILPQAMRVVLPPTGNQIVSMLKGTSLVSVLAISDLLYSAQIIYSGNYQTIPLLIVASLWYLALTTVLSYFQGLLEKRYGRGFELSAGTLRRRKNKNRSAS